MESMIIENCPICNHTARLAKDWSDTIYVCVDCDHSTSGPSCENDADAIKYWNAMMRGLKSELAK